MTKIRTLTIKLPSKKVFITIFLLLSIYVLCRMIAQTRLWHFVSYGTGDLLSDVYPWTISNASRHPEEVHHVVFVKVHKAASTTVFGIMVKLALSRQLNLMLPERGHVLTQKDSTLSRLQWHPPSPPFLFDILCNHVVFNLSAIKPAFPADTRYVAILREPFEQVKSAFYYYRDILHEKYLRQVNSFDQFFENQREYEPESPYHSYTNNRMSVDLGLDVHHLNDPSYVSSFIQHLDEVFHFVLIAERFDESMLLLKRRFRWTVKDIVYFPLNARKNKVRSVFQPSPEAMKKFERFQLFDMAIYKHFSEIFHHKVSEEGGDFSEELACYVSILNRIRHFCTSISNTSAPELVIPGSRWDKQFTLQLSECRILATEEIELNKVAKALQSVRLRPVWMA